MKPFRFRLATLLRLREAARDRRRAHLAQAYEADDVLRGRMGELTDEVVNVDKHSRQAAGAGPIKADALVVAQRYKMILQAESKLLEGQSVTVAEEIERRREVLVASDRDVKVLEKLREKHRERHQKAENREEFKLLDEVAGRMVVGGITDPHEEMI